MAYKGVYAIIMPFMPDWLQTLLWIMLALAAEKWLDHVVLPKWFRKQATHMGQRLIIIGRPAKRPKPPPQPH